MQGDLATALRASNNMHPRRQPRYRPIQSADAQDCRALREVVNAALKDQNLGTLRMLLRVIRYAEEGKTPVVVTREDLRDKWRREIILKAYGGDTGE